MFPSRCVLCSSEWLRGRLLARRTVDVEKNAQESKFPVMLKALRRSRYTNSFFYNCCTDALVEGRS